MPLCFHRHLMFSTGTLRITRAAEITCTLSGGTVCECVKERGHKRGRERKVAMVILSQKELLEVRVQGLKVMVVWEGPSQQNSVSWSLNGNQETIPLQNGFEIYLQSLSKNNQPRLLKKLCLAWYQAADNSEVRRQAFFFLSVRRALLQVTESLSSIVDIPTYQALITTDRTLVSSSQRTAKILLDLLRSSILFWAPPRSHIKPPQQHVWYRSTNSGWCLVKYHNYEYFELNYK